MTSASAILRTQAGLVVAGLCAATAAGGDWPQFRADAQRSGYTREALPSELGLLWVREARHRPQRAWVGRSLARSRMKFDWAYHVVVAGETCLFGSSADDKVYALDATTGREKWSVFTGGPVRFAPAVWRDRAFVVSDDGCLYCLRASDGGLIHKLRAGPSNERVLGNGRMVSRWVARGGPVIRDDRVYFGAGIWPTEGVHIYAVDAKTCEVVWCNDSSGALEIDQPHMVCFARSGVIAQGYLAAVKDHLLVPAGRSVPACFDRQTGRFRHFNHGRYGGKTPWGTGGADVVATDDVFFNAGMAFDVLTGLRYHPIGQRRWWIPFRRQGRRPHGEFLVGPWQEIVVTPAGFVRSEGTTLAGSTLARRSYQARREQPTALATPRLERVKWVSDKHHAERIDGAPYLKDAWSSQLPAEAKALIVAGDSMVAGLPKKVVILNRDARKPTWSAEVDGTVYGLAAASGRLYASTDEGTIYCFGEAGGRGAARLRPKTPSPYPERGLAVQAARAISRLDGIGKGYCLDLACGDGALAHALVRLTDLHVIALARDAKHAESVRRKLDRAGVYGVRVSVLVAALKDLPDYFANLILSSEAILGDGADPDDDRALRVLRPYGGVLCTGKPGALKARARGPLDRAGQWTHNLADAANTLYSGDAIVRGPLGMLWYKDETHETIDRHGKNPAPLVTRGLLLRLGFDALRCTDAYNGTLVWERKLPGILEAYREGTQVGAGQIGSTFCVAGDLVYVRRKGECLRFALRTGEALKPISSPTFPGGEAGRWGYIACEDGFLFGGLMNERYVIKAQHGKGDARTQKPMEDHLTETSLLFALDAATGKLKWTFEPQRSIRNTAIAIGGGKVFLIDREPAAMDALLKSEVRRRGRKGGVPAHRPGQLIALDAKTGQKLWQAGEAFGTALGLSAAHDVLVMSYNRIGFARPSDSGSAMQAYRGSTGGVLWRSQRSGLRPAIAGRTVFSFPLAFDLRTGEPKTVQTPAPGRARGALWRIEGKDQGCGLVAASQHLLTLRSATLAYYDLTYDKGWLEDYGGLRAGCFINAIPACGLVIAPDDTRACRCSYQNQASIALIPHGIRPPDVEPQPGQENFAYFPRSREPLFSGELVVVMNHQRDDVEIRYTLDDSYPTAASPLYTKPITITKTTPIRASAFLNGTKVAIRDAVLFRKVDDIAATIREGTRRGPAAKSRKGARNGSTRRPPERRNTR